MNQFLNMIQQFNLNAFKSLLMLKNMMSLKILNIKKLHFQEYVL